MTNEYQTVKLPKGLIKRIRMQIQTDDSYLNVSDYVRHAVRNLLSDLKVASNTLSKR
ncbi:MAG: hypothetical protein U9R08_01210 [Nanoarchaeota archaeon]|nr:hypothetical protein [Nanoarchaeota archaeon]